MNPVLTDISKIVGKYWTAPTKILLDKELYTVKVKNIDNSINTLYIFMNLHGKYNTFSLHSSDTSKRVISLLNKRNVNSSQVSHPGYDTVIEAKANAQKDWIAYVKYRTSYTESITVKIINYLNEEHKEL